MKSKAVVKGHPLHPMLIPFPFAFLAGAVAFDVLAWITRAPALWATGAHLTLAGVATGLLAAVPGLVDYALAVPPDSSAKRRATRHLLANASALVLFAAAWVVRAESVVDAHLGTLVLEASALALLGAGGWMGGTLVYRNQIAVDHRYAGAGRWREIAISRAGGDGPVPIGRHDDLQVNQMKLVHLNGRRIVLARTEQGFAAFEDRCTHKGGSLADGALICGTVQCPWHGSQFDVASGRATAGPAEQPIETFGVREEGGELRIDLA